jgi:hypothetical protein
MINKERIRIQLIPDASSVLLKLAKESGESPTRYVTKLIYLQNQLSSGVAINVEGKEKNL